MAVYYSPPIPNIPYVQKNIKMSFAVASVCIGMSGPQASPFSDSPSSDSIQIFFGFTKFHLRLRSTTEPDEDSFICVYRARRKCSDCVSMSYMNCDLTCTSA